MVNRATDYAKPEKMHIKVFSGWRQDEGFCEIPLEIGKFGKNKTKVVTFHYMVAHQPPFTKR